MERETRNHDGRNSDCGVRHFRSRTTGTAEVFRLYNNNSGVHLYTANAGEKNAILATFPGIWVQHSSFGFAVP